MDVEMEIPMPDSTVPADIYVFINGEPREQLNKKMVVPNSVQFLKMTVTEQREEYDVLIMMCKSGMASGDAKVYASYKVYGKTGLWTPTMDPVLDVMAQFETTPTTTPDTSEQPGENLLPDGSTDSSTDVQA
jgi:hypothetical protein